LSPLARGRGFLILLGLFVLLAASIVLLRPAVLPPLRVGSPAPEFRLPVLGQEGSRTLSPADLRGRVVFINFWATWCPPCRDEAPSLERLYQRLKPKGLEVLGVTIDDPGALEAVAGFQREFALSFPILLDSSQTVYRDYQATGVPETFVISPEGRLIERVVGPRDWADPRYGRLVERLLAQKGGPS
jgi:peroxiredoxin